VITPLQSRMARAALDWSIEDLALNAKVGKNTAIRFEKGSDVRVSTARSIEETFRTAGIEFIGEDGVRYRGQRDEAFQHSG
jgi:DNA-binding XRE family transcriptional regulator